MGFKIICMLGSLFCTYNFTAQRYNAQTLQREKDKLRMVADILMQNLTCLDKTTRKNYEYFHTIGLNDVISEIVNPILEKVTISVIRARDDATPCLNATIDTLRSKIQTGLNDAAPCIRTYKLRTDAFSERVNRSIADITTLKKNIGNIDFDCATSSDRWNCSFSKVVDIRHVLEAKEAEDHKVIYDNALSDYVDCLISIMTAIRDNVDNVVADAEKCIKNL